ncbi:MAG: hypothetical protein LUH03_05645 [Oscillospiraceae bacterium]|nr:hypothetical protein [Oscillospiraceae bacterium]
MLKNKNLRMFACLLTALMVLFAFSGCGDNSTTDGETDADNATIDTPETSEEGTKAGSGDDLSLGLSDGDTYLSRDDYTLLGDYYYTESYHVENEDSGAVSEIGLDMYLSYDEENGYSDADGVLAVYYDEETGDLTGYEAYVGIYPIRATVNYQVAANSSYFTCVCLDSDSNVTKVIWDNYVENTDTGVKTYYTGYQTYYSDGSTESTYEEQYTISDDGTLSLTQTTTKEYDEDGNVTTDETVEY